MRTHVIEGIVASIHVEERDALQLTSTSFPCPGGSSSVLATVMNVAIVSFPSNILMAESLEGAVHPHPSRA